MREVITIIWVWLLFQKNCKRKKKEKNGGYLCHNFFFYTSWLQDCGSWNWKYCLIPVLGPWIWPLDQKLLSPSYKDMRKRDLINFIMSYEGSFFLFHKGPRKIAIEMFSRNMKSQYISVPFVELKNRKSFMLWSFICLPTL